jgi:hypothetical protein
MAALPRRQRQWHARWPVGVGGTLPRVRRRVATGVEAHMQPHPPSSTVAVVGKTTLPRRWRWPLDVDPDKAVAGSNLGLVGLDSGSGFFFKN